MTKDIKKIKDNNNDDDKFTLKDFLQTLVYVAVLYAILNIFFLSSVVDGTSMVPTYQDRDRLFVCKVAYVFSDPQRGDIISFNPPLSGRENERFIKRVIGLPGEQVDVSNGVVTVTTTDGVVHTLDEDYISGAPNYEYHSGVIPDGFYVVFGDNRNGSYDSHYGWMITKDNIIGKALLDFWPLDKFGMSPNVEYDF